MSTQSTPGLFWKGRGPGIDACIYSDSGDGGILVAVCDAEGTGPDAIANAELIVRAVNSHANLLAAAKAALAQLEAAISAAEGGR